MRTIHARSLRRATAVGLALAAVLTACSSDTADPSEDDTPSATEAGEPASTETDTGSEPADDAEWQSIVEAAQEEGAVTIYSGQGAEQLDQFAAAFEEEYGIEVEAIRGIDADLIPRVEAEMETGGVADIYFAADLGWVQEKDAEGWFLEPVGPNIIDNPDYDFAERAPEGTYFEASAAVLTFAWNTELYPEGITDYPDVLAPELAGGQIGVVDPSAPSLVDFYLYLEEEYGESFVDDLAAQEPRIYPSALPMVEALIAGEISVATFVVPPTPQIEAGAPIDYGFPPKVMGYRYNGLILESAPHPNAAQVVANYMLSEEGQTLIARDFAAAVPDIEGSFAVIDDVRKQDPEALTADAVRAYQERFDQLFR